MAIRYDIEKHAYSFPGKVLAREGGAHIFSVRINEDTDNGVIIRRGKFVNLDLYEEDNTPASTLTAVIRDKANAAGRWYVEIKENPDHELFLYDETLISEEYNNSFKKLSNYFNEAGKVVRAYDLVHGDVLEIPEELFEGTPEKGKSITIANKKYVVGA